MENKVSQSQRPYDFYTFPNGLRLLTVPMPSASSVTVLVLVATGSRYETREISGISHFLEHMIFKGTEKRSGTMDIAHELDSIGADYNAFTSKEYTGYYVKCSAEKIDIAMDVISDIFQNSKFDPKEIEKERGAIKEEINMYLDNPARHVSELFDELMYGDHPLGWDVAGRKEIIDSLKREDFLNYFSSRYFDKNTVIAVAGKVTPKETKEKIVKYFDKIRDGITREPLKNIDDQNDFRLKIFNKKTDQTHINLGFRAYDRLDPKYETLTVLSSILGGGMSSRLFDEVRQKRGLAYRIGSGSTSYLETGDFSTSAGLNSDNLIPALKIILEEHRKISRELVTEKELARIKDYAKGRLAIGLETSDAQAGFYGEQELLENRILTPEERFEKIMAVTREDVMEVAREIVKPEKLNLAVVGPIAEDNEEIKKVLSSW